MADNVATQSGTLASAPASTTFATDDIGGVHYPITKLAWGPLDTANLVDDADGKRMPVKTPTASTSTDVSLASSNVTAQLLAANANRKGLYITNTDANDLYLYFGTTATLTKFTMKIPTGMTYIMPYPIYTGRIDAIWAADGSGSAIGSEL